jgi:2,3-bisphosphoglycerate-dependent phosphoglycerate mutase
MHSTAIFIRHCESRGQSPDASLTAKGFLDARHLVQRLKGLNIDAIYSSPYARATQTIDPFVVKTGLPLRIEPRLHERILSVEAREDWLEQVRFSFENFDHRAPGGETLHEAQARGLAALDRTIEDGATNPAIVSHGNLLSTLLNRADRRFGFDAWRAMTNPAVYKVRLQSGVPVSFEALD